MDIVLIWGELGLLCAEDAVNTFTWIDVHTATSFGSHEKDSIFTNPTFCPHSAFMCFVWISEQTAIISLNNINWFL
jgi:hypothetical protein